MAKESEFTKATLKMSEIIQNASKELKDKLSKQLPYMTQKMGGKK